MRNFFDFTGKKYLITGASSGIGRSTAIELSNQGARVVLVARDEKRLEETLQQMAGTEHRVIPLDLAKTDDLSNLMAGAVEDGLPIDGIVHCAGVGSLLPLSLLNRTSMNDCMKVNFYSFIELVRCGTKKKFRAPRMSIVAMSSVSALYPKKCQTIYAASKAALNTAIQALAVELADKGVRINSICAGAVDTRMTQDAAKAASNFELNPQTLGILRPEQIACSIMYLLSDASSNMTGRFLFADGGMVL
ncbi:MAG: SDR family oxidoreductase [Fretibacterium sp.]|nr:SDR family oxidoreductase [Fretibacterium sp.]